MIFSQLSYGNFSSSLASAEAFVAEKNFLINFKSLIDRSVETLHLWQVLNEHNFEEVILHLEPVRWNLKVLYSNLRLYANIFANIPFSSWYNHYLVQSKIGKETGIAWEPPLECVELLPPKFTPFLKLLYAFWLWLSFGMPVLVLIVFSTCLRTQNLLLITTTFLPSPPPPTHTHLLTNNILNLVFAYQTLMEKVRHIKILIFHLLFQQNVMSIVVIMKEC